MSKMREEFDVFAAGKGWDISHNGQHYNHVYAYYAWIGWQASRQALVVELPVTCCRTHVFEIPWTNEVGMEHDEYFEVEDIHKCLDAAGIKYK